MREIRAVVFDLDGTLVHSAPDLRTALNRLLAEEGRRPLTLDEVAGMIGDGALKLVERGFTATGGLTHDIDELTQRFLGHYEGNAAEETRPYDGVPEALSTLTERGLQLGVCTNKPEGASREVLTDLDLAKWFKVIVGGDTLDNIRKPDPRPLLTVLEGLGVAPSSAIMVGDNAHDVATARAAGIPVVIRAGGYTRTPTAELGADAILEAFRDLPDVLADISRR